MAGIVQGVMGDALFPDLTAMSSVSNASEQVPGHSSGYKNISEKDAEELTRLGWSSEDLDYYDSHYGLKGFDDVFRKLDKQSRDFNSDNYVDYMKGLAIKGNKDAIDWLVNYYSTWEANKWAAERDDSAYQRLNKDLMAAGISPYVLSGATPQISSVKMPNSSSFADTEKNKRSKESTDRGNVLQMIGYGLLTAGRIIAALL